MKKVIIFGTNRGIGLSFVKKYISSGYEVTAVCRNSSKELEALECYLYKDVDVTNLDALNKISNELRDKKFDILIHNAGIWTNEDIFNITSNTFSEITRAFEVNTIAPLKVISVFKKHLNSNSKIDVLSSRMGSIADNDSGGRYAYRMSKAALNAGFKSLSIDLETNPVLILHPGYVKTDMTNHNGLIDTFESVDGLFNIIENATIKDSGKFWHTSGELLKW